MAGAEELASRKTSASSNLSELDRRSSLATGYNLNEALTLEDTAAVYSSLFEVRHKWFNIGLEVGVHITKLNDIERERNDDSKALRKMLMIALEKQISGQRLCDALRECAVDEPVLAKNLEINLPRSIISRRLQTTNFITHYQGTSDIQLTSNSSSSSITTSFEVGSTGMDQGLTVENRSSSNDESVSKAAEGVSSLLPDVVTTGQSKVNPKIKRLPNHYNDKECTHCFKVNVVGDPGVGKSTMLLRYMKSSFTFGDSMLGPTLQWETVGVCVFQYNDERIKLYLWDTAGCEQNFDSIPTRYFTDVHGTIIMFDVSQKQTLVNALSDRGSNRGRKQKSWIKEVDFRAEDDNLPVKLLVGGKIDIQEREVTSEEAEKYASRLGLPYLEVSSKEQGLGIQEVFYKMVELLMDKCSGQHTTVKHYWPHSDTDPLLNTSSPNITVANTSIQNRERHRCHCS